MIASDSQRCPLPMPMGWFQVLYASDLEIGDAVPLRYFGQELVAFRTESGAARVVDAYCPHMGAHLGYGIRDNAGKGPRVVGESLECPFHGWQWNGEGQCTHIPYAKNLPPRVAKGEALLGAWEVREINQQILVWYHPNKEAPTWEPEPIEEALAGNTDWTGFDRHEWEIHSHMQEIGENGVDGAHFHYVHGTSEVPEAEIQSFDGYKRHAKFVTRQPTPRGVVDGAIETRSYGTGLSVVRFSGIYDTILLANITPVEREVSHAMYAFIQPKATAETLGKSVGQAIIANICQQMEEDQIIWQRKRYFERPVLCDGDGPFAKFRRWYDQFLVEAH
ncbi:MAG: Rieske 2Fe-2S domain-containing protein [Luminiphilus sp.]|jgi:3-ketosteroid 9alpha-monooxygenase subunit A|nr:Rieske 2Fe-2S domain-containing protein [Luminiphilus sp.]MDG1460790.1 Rieske 2Fe-2S domain-containing protein [Luminiphilus sp.]